MARTSSRDYTGASFGEPFASKRKRGDPYSYVVQGIDAHGERFQLKRSASTNAAALAAITGAIELARDGITSRSTTQRVTMRVLYQRWWEHHAAIAEQARDGETTSRVLSDSSRIRYRNVWEKHLEPALADRIVETVTHAEIHDLLRVDRKSRPKPLLDALRSLFRYAEGAGIIEPHRNPTRGGFELRTTRPKPQPVDLATLDIIENHLAELQPAWKREDPTRLHDSFVLMRSSGMRISEALAIRVEDFDPERRTVRVTAHVARTLSGDSSRRSISRAIPGSKTQAGERTLVLPPRAAAILTKRVAGKAPTDFVFATSSGTAMATENWRTMFAREISTINVEREASGLPLLANVHPHRLRATVASAIVQSLVAKHGLAAGLESARKQLGHRGTATLVHYVTEQAQVEDHSSILEELDSVAMKARTARAIIEKLEPEIYWALEVVSTERSTNVVAVEPLTDAQRETVIAALEPHGIRLLS